MNNTDLDKLQSQTIDWLRYPLMLFIVLIHAETALLYSLPQSGTSQIIYYITRTIIRVAVPLYFIFSGYWFFRNTETFTLESYSSKIRKRLRTILIPYIFWNYFLWGLQMLIDVLQGHASWIPRAAFEFKNILDVMIGFGEGYQGMPKGYQLWFLRDLMIIFLFTPQLYLLLKRRKPYVLLILVLLYLLPFPHGWNLVFSKFPTALLFFSIGAYMGIHKQNMVKIARNIPLWLSISITVIALVFHVWQCTIQGQHEFLAQKIYALVSVVPTIQLASLLVERRQLKPRAFIADSNFLLFMIHPPLMHYLVVETLTGKLSNTPFHFWLAYTTELLVPVVGCIILYAIMHRLIPKTTSFLTGGRS